MNDAVFNGFYYEWHQLSIMSDVYHPYLFVDGSRVYLYTAGKGWSRLPVTIDGRAILSFDGNHFYGTIDIHWVRMTSLEVEQLEVRMSRLELAIR